MDQAEARYSALDLEGFRLSMDQVAVDLPCLDAVVTPGQAARYHRLQGLRASVLREEDRAKAAFLAARLSDPGFTLPESLVPSGHPLRRTYGALPLEGGGTVPLPAPVEGQLWLDGQVKDQRHNLAPTLLQQVDGQGETILSRYLWPEDPLPAYAQLPVATPRPRAVAGLAWGAGAAALAGGGLYGLAALKHDRYYDPATPLSELGGLRRASNGLGAAGLGLGATAVGLGLSAFLVSR